MWTIGLAETGNEMGLTEAQIDGLDPEIRKAKLARAHRRMRQAGAHYVVDGISDVSPVLDEINVRLAAGERP
jgi:phosphonoacetaldehyde hydrolase